MHPQTSQSDGRGKRHVKQELKSDRLRMPNSCVSSRRCLPQKDTTNAEKRDTYRQGGDLQRGMIFFPSLYGLAYP